MHKGKTILCLIPARGGSKGLPHKNIKLLLDKPLISWTIQQAKNNKYIDRIIVSTDDETIAKISKEYGAEVPFMRPKELAQDDSAVSDTIIHALDFFESKKKVYDILLLLECTSPMRYEEDISNIINKLINNKKANSVVGVVEAISDHPSWSLRLANGYLAWFISESSTITNFNRQLLEKAYLPYSLFATWCNNFKKYKTFYQPNTLAYLLKREQKVGIDDEVDFYLAECILKKYLIKNKKNSAFQFKAKLCCVEKK